MHDHDHSHREHDHHIQHDGHGRHEHHEHHGHDGHEGHDQPRLEVRAPILVTINPEARVSVERTAAPLGPALAGEWVDVPFAVLNEGFVTGPLTIQGDQPAGVELELPQLRLTGERLQFGAFRVRLSQSGFVDVTLRFWALGALGGLANKNTLALLLRTAEPV